MLTCPPCHHLPHLPCRSSTSAWILTCPQRHRLLHLLRRHSTSASIWAFLPPRHLHHRQFTPRSLLTLGLTSLYRHRRQPPRHSTWGSMLPFRARRSQLPSHSTSGLIFPSTVRRRLPKQRPPHHSHSTLASTSRWQSLIPPHRKQPQNVLDMTFTIDVSDTIVLIVSIDHPLQHLSLDVSLPPKLRGGNLSSSRRRNHRMSPRRTYRRRNPCRKCPRRHSRRLLPCQLSMRHQDHPWLVHWLTLLAIWNGPHCNHW